MNNPRAAIEAIHRVWNEATGQKIPLRLCDYEVETGWKDFLASYDEQDLRFVVAFLTIEINHKRRQPAALRWSNLIGNRIRFGEEMELAKADAALRRRPRPTARDQALESVRPGAVKMPETGVVSISEVLKAMRLAAG